MPRTGSRIRVGTGIYRDDRDGPYEIRVTVNGIAYFGRAPKDSTQEELKRARAKLESKARSDHPVIERGTLAADARKYLIQIKHLESWQDRKAHLDAWIALVGNVYRHRITAADVLRARVRWLEQTRKSPKGKRLPPLSPKTINHRVATLRHLYRTLDGKKAPSPCDEVSPLDVPKTPIERIPNALILTVDQNLQRMEQRKGVWPLNAKTRARFRVFVSTGKRPIEIMRAKPGDVNLEARVWVPRDAKGGFCPGVYLNDDMLEAWKLFIAEKAWGKYNQGSFSRTLRSAGWPAGVRLYQARHSMWITASEMGIDLHDIATGAGHTDPRTTRKAYVPVLNSRLQTMSERMDGRFGGWRSAPERGSE